MQTYLQMKKIILLLFVLVQVAFAQEEDDRQAKLKYNLFKGDYLAKNYDRAYPNWLWCFENAPKLTVNIYKLGYKILKEKRKKAKEKKELEELHELTCDVYRGHIKHFPKNLAKVYSDYAEYLHETKAPEDEYFSLLEKAYDSDPSQMGVKAIGRYFNIITRKNKDTDIALIFKTYDQLMEAVNRKMDKYTLKLDEFAKKQDNKDILLPKEIRMKKAYEINSRSLGKVESILDKIIIDIATCERLVPLYKSGFEVHKTDAAWLKSAVSRMYKKECTDNPLYDKLVETYVTVSPSPEASVFYAGILLKKNQENKAKTFFEKAVKQESDPYKKAKYLFKIAQIMRKKGSFEKARKYAYEALKYKRSLGDAYLLIARMYAKSANNCGKTEFEKRMVYVAAMEKAKMALAVDPVIKNIAKKYIKSYKSSAPSKKDIFTEGIKSGTDYKIHCWIQETVKVP